MVSIAVSAPAAEQRLKENTRRTSRANRDLLFIFINSFPRWNQHKP
jgi:hypothetical protein